MALRILSASDRALLRRATLANMNWNEPRFTLDDVDSSDGIAHYYTGFPSERDFGLVDLEDITEDSRSPCAEDDNEQWVLARPRLLDLPVLKVNGKLNLRSWTA